MEAKDSDPTQARANPAESTAQNVSRRFKEDAHSAFARAGAGWHRCPVRSQWPPTTCGVFARNFTGRCGVALDRHPCRMGIAIRSHHVAARTRTRLAERVGARAPLP